IFLGNERRGRGGLIDWDRANAEASRLMAQVGLDEDPTAPASRRALNSASISSLEKRATLPSGVTTRKPRSSAYNGAISSMR
ncbi:hypothetical protein, partial [Burkholderia sp. SIMBA_024]|uniref:hypothetical protein n=1 Tax=Burkholderia sp. SIMBA_024 TaxID=3085768 RepID=UPI00397D3D1B